MFLPLQVNTTYRIPGPLGRDMANCNLLGVRPWPITSRPEPALPAFPKISRIDFYNNLSARTRDIGSIDQNVTSLCGPASLMYLVGKNQPDNYYRFVTELYELGQSRLGALHIKPGEDCKNYDPRGEISAVDWVSLAGIRDSENAIFDYDDASDQFAGITLPGELAGWFEAVGFSAVINETNLYFTKGQGDFEEALELHRQGYTVCLFVNGDGVGANPRKKGAGQIFTSANHWVVLTQVHSITPAAVNFVVFTWGSDTHRVPQSGATMPMDHWLQNFYGYVACRV